MRQIDRKTDLPFETVIRFNRGYYFEGTLKEDDDYMYDPTEELEFDDSDGNWLNEKKKKTLPFYNEELDEDLDDEEQEE